MELFKLCFIYIILSFSFLLFSDESVNIVKKEIVSEEKEQVVEESGIDRKYNGKNINRIQIKGVNLKNRFFLFKNVNIKRNTEYNYNDINELYNKISGFEQFEEVNFTVDEVGDNQINLLILLKEKEEIYIKNSGIDEKYNGKVITKIEFRGLKRTKLAVIDPKLEIKAGDIYDIKKIQELNTSIENLKVFSEVDFIVEDPNEIIENEEIEIQNDEEEKDNQDSKSSEGIILVIQVKDPWTLIPLILPSYNTSSGFRLDGGLFDSNFLGLMHFFKVGGGLSFYTEKDGWLYNYSAEIEYNMILPQLPKFTFSARSLFRKDIEKEYSLDKTDEIIWKNDHYDYEQSFGIDYQIFDFLTVGGHIEGMYKNNTVLVNEENRKESVHEGLWGTGTEISYNKMNYFEGGTILHGFKVNTQNTFYLNKGYNFSFLNKHNTTFTYGVNVKKPEWWLYFNYVGKVNYHYFHGKRENLGGGDRLRGFSSKDVQGNNGLFWNNEFRLTFLDTKFIRLAGVAVFDTAVVIQDWDFQSTKWYGGFGPGIRLYPKFLGGLVLRTDIVWDVMNFDKGPQISFSLLEMIQ